MKGRPGAAYLTSFLVPFTKHYARFKEESYDRKATQKPASENTRSDARPKRQVHGDRSKLVPSMDRETRH